ncbi:MAG: hypothetical protein V1779_17205 [bacterium]
MTPYEEYKARLKVTKEGTESKNSGECTPCRLKIAQDTFNMVTGGSQYLPTNEPLPGYFKTVEELCYPYHNNTDNRHLENAIDRLYGRKMPDYNPDDVIGELYGFFPHGRIIDDSDKPQGIPEQPSSEKFGTDVPIDLPCWEDDYIDHIFWFFRRQDVFNLDSEGNLFLKFPNRTLSLNIKDITYKLIKEIFCRKSRESTGFLYWNFFLTLIKDSIEKFLLENATFDEVEYYHKIIEEEIVEKILYDGSLAQGDGAPLIQGIPDRFLNLNGIHDRNCLCGGPYPTYCCEPEKNPELCYCNGEIRNLCDFCKIDLPLPSVLKIWSKSDSSQEKCGYEIYKEEDINSEEIDRLSSITYHVLGLTSYGRAFGKYNFNDLEYCDEYNDQRKLPLEVPIDEECDILLVLSFPCNWCCNIKISEDPPIWEKTNRRRDIQFELKNFNYQEWIKKNKYEREHFLNLDIILDGESGSEEFTKDCVSC